MGLPLFIARVESDVPPKPAAKSPSHPGHARSPIRRSTPDRRRQLLESRDARLRMVTALQGNNEDLLPSSSNRPTQDAPRSDVRPPLELPDDGPLLDAAALIARARELERQEARTRQAVMDVLSPPEDGSTSAQDFSALAQRNASTRSPPNEAGSSQTVLDPANETSNSAVDLPEIASRFRWRRDAQQQLNNLRRLQAQEQQLRGSMQAILSRPENNRSSSRHAPRRADHNRPRFARPGQRVRHADGLGDRDRSLSPEGDGVWDTLQSTLTPDPQPPSVGSSFASTTASAAASYTTVASSSNTPITDPDGETERPCDPIEEGSGSEVGEDWLSAALESARESVHRRLGPNQSERVPVHARSYAAVAREPRSSGSVGGTGESLEADREWLSGMHRIVRGLATREDIPDEWWAQAGLSRSLSWEESN